MPEKNPICNSMTTRKDYFTHFELVSSHPSTHARHDMQPRDSTPKMSNLSGWFSVFCLSHFRLVQYSFQKVLTTVCSSYFLSQKTRARRPRSCPSFFTNPAFFFVRACSAVSFNTKPFKHRELVWIGFKKVLLFPFCWNWWMVRVRDSKINSLMPTRHAYVVCVSSTNLILAGYAT